MGRDVTAKCNCGYIMRDMPLGSGMIGSDKVNEFPNYCINCKSLFVANMFDEVIICVHCKSINTVPYNHSYVVKSLDDVAYTSVNFKLSKKNNLCPQCNQFSLEFIAGCMWD